MQETDAVQVLLLDGDNLPLRNPEALFESPEYKMLGNLFFPDFWNGVNKLIQEMLMISSKS